MSSVITSPPIALAVEEVLATLISMGASHPLRGMPGTGRYLSFLSILAAVDNHFPRLHHTIVVWVVVLGVFSQRRDILIPHSVNICSLSSLAREKALEHIPSPLLPLIFV